jgi:Zn-dependent protease
MLKTDFSTHRHMTTFLLIVFLWIFSVCLHEYAHAIVAYKGGDTSVKEKGYLSLNPISYLDPFTSVLIPTLVLILGGIGLPGAAVYINTGALRSRGWQSAVSLAGPAMNLLILLVISLVISAFGLSGTSLGAALAFFALLQASSVVLNMLPIPGFDGFGAIDPYLPTDVRIMARQFSPMLMMGFIALVFIVPAFSHFIWGACLKIAFALGINGFDIQIGYKAFRFWKD